MCKWQRVISRHKGSSRYRIAHGWKMSGSFNLEALKFLMHFREPGCSHSFIFTQLIFFSFSHIYIFFFFLSLSYSFFSFSFSSKFFICSPWTLNCIVPTSSPMLRRLLVLRQRGDKNKVGTGKTFPLERYLESSMLAPSCDFPWIDDPFSTIGCGQGGKHKRWFLV
jgi:hypothetical protein